MSEKTSSYMVMKLACEYIRNLIHIVEEETAPIGYGKGGTERYQKWRQRNHIDALISGARDIHDQLEQAASVELMRNETGDED